MERKPVAAIVTTGFSVYDDRASLLSKPEMRPHSMPQASTFMGNFRRIAGIAIALSLVACTRSRAAQPGVDFFPIMPWETPWTKEKLLGDANIGIASLRECGFTTAAFPTAGQLPLCNETGLRAIVALPKGPTKWRSLSDQQIVEKVKALVGDTHDNDAVIGYFLVDEPGAPDFPALAKAVAEVKRLAPGKIAYINLFPDYATLGAPDLSQLGTTSYREYLDRFVREVKPQLISYDNYRVPFSHDLADRRRAESYFANLLEIRRVALEHDLPFWNIVCSNQIRPETTIPSPASLAVQANTTLAAGAKGLTWYTYYAVGYRYAPIDNDGRRTPTWSYLRTINEQVRTWGPILKPLRSTGVYFTSPPLAASLPVLPGKLIAGVNSAPSAPAMIGEFVGDSGQKFAMIVNLNLERSAKFTITSADPGDVRSISPVDGSATPLESNSIWLPAGQGTLLEFPQ